MIDKIVGTMVGIAKRRKATEGEISLRISMREKSSLFKKAKKKK